MRWFPSLTVLCGASLGWLPGLRAEADWPQWRGPTRDGRTSHGAAAPGRLPEETKEARIVWHVNVGSGLASPVVAGGKVFHLDGIEGKETLHALDPSTGRELWRATVDDSFQDEQGPSGPRCTPLVDGEFIYAQSCRGELQCRAVREGRLVWRANFRKDFGAVLLGEDSKVPGAAEHGYTASPLVVGEQLIACAGGTNGAGIVSFDKRAGTVLWRSQSDLASYAAPILARNRWSASPWRASSGFRPTRAGCSGEFP